MLKDFKYFMEHYNQYEDKIKDLISCNTDYLMDDIKESQDKNKDTVFDWEYLCTNYINIDAVVDCILCNEWEDYDNLNDLEDITCHMLDLFKISIKERLKTEGYDDTSISQMLQELTKDNL
jgi:hypothetical protein